MTIWSLTVEVPPTVSIQRKRKGRVVTIETAAFPAIHNLRDWRLRSQLTKLHKRLLDEALLHKRLLGWIARQLMAEVKIGRRYDVMLIRRAPRPLVGAVQQGDWGGGGGFIGGDNAGSSLKAARDWAAKRVFGLAGDSSPLVRWSVGQERSALPRQYQLVVAVVPAMRHWWELPDLWLRGAL
jgi:hypothetical protein